MNIEQSSSRNVWGFPHITILVYQMDVLIGPDLAKDE